MNSCAQHAPALQHLDQVAVIARTVIVMAGRAQVAHHRALRLAQSATLGFQFDKTHLAMRPEKHQVGKSRRDAHPFQPRRGRAIARTIGGGHPHAMLDPRQRHQLLLADRTRDPEAVTAVIAGMRNKDRGPTLAEIEDALRAGAGVSYLIRTAEGFEVVVGFAASRRALAEAGVTAEQNRQLLASVVNPDQS